MITQVRKRKLEETLEETLYNAWLGLFSFHEKMFLCHMMIEYLARRRCSETNFGRERNVDVVMVGLLVLLMLMVPLEPVSPAP